MVSPTNTFARTNKYHQCWATKKISKTGCSTISLRRTQQDFLPASSTPTMSSQVRARVESRSLSNAMHRNSRNQKIYNVINHVYTDAVYMFWVYLCVLCSWKFPNQLNLRFFRITMHHDIHHPWHWLTYWQLLWEAPDFSDWSMHTDLWHSVTPPRSLRQTNTSSTIRQLECRLCWVLLGIQLPDVRSVGSEGIVLCLHVFIWMASRKVRAP